MAAGGRRARPIALKRRHIKCPERWRHDVTRFASVNECGRGKKDAPNEEKKNNNEEEKKKRKL